MSLPYIPRVLPLAGHLEKKSVLLLGPRRSGKSALIRTEIKPDVLYDLLHSETYRELSSRPSLIRERLQTTDRLIVIDEIQKLPVLMDEVHSLIEENKKLRFVITGSSARKIKRSHTSLMAGRARTLILHPFSWLEVEGRFDLSRILNRGLLPPVALESDDQEAWQELRDYTGDYLREEILAEAWVRSIDRFSNYLTVAAASNGEILNFESIGSDAQVPARTVREYYAVLEDTLLGCQLHAFRPKKGKDRKSVSKSKFFFFDPGVVNALLNRRSVSEDAPEMGPLFETWVHHEVRLYLHAQLRDETLTYWRNHEGREVDFMLGDDVAIEVKGSRIVSDKHLQGLASLEELTPLRKKWVISRDSKRRKMRAGKSIVEIIPWQEFPRALWDGEILG